jgi:hypothetical protein
MVLLFSRIDELEMVCAVNIEENGTKTNTAATIIIFSVPFRFLLVI